MRAWVFRKLLFLLERRTPRRFAAVELQILLDMTSRAFRTERKRIWTLPAEEALQAYAAYTVRCMKTCGTPGNRLYAEAERVGRTVRRLTGFTRPEDLERLVFWLYRNIGIRMRGHIPGVIRVSRCYFAGFYTPEQCAVMSAADAGIMAGICGSGSLRFTGRITEGYPCCRGEVKRDGSL